jgi:predicted transcriptional regulator
VNRSRIELVALILQAAIEGSTATKMLSKVLPSNMQLKQYLVILQQNGLLDYCQNEQTYTTTSKAFHWLPDILFSKYFKYIEISSPKSPKLRLGLSKVSERFKY